MNTFSSVSALGKQHVILHNSMKYSTDKYFYIFQFSNE